MTQNLMRIELVGRSGVVCAAAALALINTIALSTGVAAQQTPQAEAANYFAERQTADALKTLSPPAQAVMARLSRLDSMPISDWRFHIGDLAHG